MAEAIIKLEPALWAFVPMEEVEPTHNRAERALRPAVCMRKQQQRNVLDYLTAAMRAHLHGQTPPSLLPDS